MFDLLKILTYNFSCVKNCPPAAVNFVKNSNTNYHLDCVFGCDGAVYKWLICFDNNNNSCKVFQTGTSKDFQVEEDFVSASKSFYVVVQLGGKYYATNNSSVNVLYRFSKIGK